MFFLSIKIAFKNLLNRKNPSLLSILGLAIAFTSLFYIYSYVSFELNYDSFHKNTKRIYRISGDIVAVENTMTHAVLGPLMGPKLKEEFPAIEEFTRLFPTRKSILLKTEDNQFTIEEAYTADQSIFDVFTLNFIYGDKKSALSNPNEIVINQSLSLKIFGDKNPIGQTLKKENKLLTVTGVITDSPENAHHKLNILFSMGDWWKNLEGISNLQISEAYWMPSAYLFILLKPKTKIEDITDNFEIFYQTHMAKFGKVINAKFDLIPIPLKDLHFSRHMSYDYPKGNITYTYLLILVGIFILLIATINYSNLLISQNITQQKSIRIKTIMGASNLSLYIQSLLNSLVIILTSILLALFIFSITLPQLKLLAEINTSIFSISKIISLSLILLIITGFISSVIPFLNQLSKTRIRLSQFQLGNIKFGKISTIVQYALSIVLIMSVIIITRQLNFLLNSDMGFNKEDVIILKLNNSISSQAINSYKDELLKNPFVTNISYSTKVPGDVLESFAFQINRDGQEVTKIVNSMGIDYDYIPLMGMKLKEGRNFQKRFGDDDNRRVIINEALIDFCGLSGKITGTQIGNTTVVGVVRDVSFNSLHSATEPIMFFLKQESNGFLNIKLNTAKNINEAVNAIQALWKDFFKDDPFNIQFLDNRVKMMYAEDQKKNTLVKIFTLISIFISLMGLFNLSSIITKRKTKEKQKK